MSFSAAASSDDDEIVSRLPVYLSQELAHNLYLLQFPLRAKNRPYSDIGEVTAARVKPRQRCVELDIPMDVESGQIDPDADYEMPTLTLASQPVPPKTNYAVALVRGGRVVLTPLHATCRMMPSFAHVEKALDEERADADRKKGIDPSPGAGDDEQELAPVLVKFRRQHGGAGAGADRAGMRRMTYQYLRLLQSQEPWVDLKIHNPDSSSTRFQHDKLVVLPQRKVEFTMTAREYVEYVAPSADVHGGASLAQGNVGGSTADSAGSSFSISAASSFSRSASLTSGSLVSPAASPSASGSAGIGATSGAGAAGGYSGMLPGSMPTFGGPVGVVPDDVIAQRALSLILAARVITTRQAVQAIGLHSVAELDSLVGRLERIAYLIHGCWVAKSEALYDLRRVPAEYRRVLARNLVICAFAKSRVVDRKVIAAETRAERGLLDDVMEELAVRAEAAPRQWLPEEAIEAVEATENGKKGPTGLYVFKMVPDAEFLEHFPDVAEAFEGVFVDLEKNTKNLLVPLKP